MLNRWSQSLSGSPETSSQILSQFLWFNKYIKIDGTAIHFPKSLIKVLIPYRSYLKMAGSYHGSILKTDMNWQITCFSVGSIETCNSYEMEKKIFFDYSDTNENDLCQNRRVIKGAWILPLDKLSSEEIYSILISNIVNKPTSNIFFEKLFGNTTLDWNKIYLSPRLATIDTTLRSF